MIALNRDGDVEKEDTLQAALFLRPIGFEGCWFFGLQHWEVGKTIFFFMLLA
jgi:hypothetical protein